MVTPKKLVPIFKPGTSFLNHVLMKRGQPQKLRQVLELGFWFSEFKKWGQYGCQSIKLYEVAVILGRCPPYLINKITKMQRTINGAAPAR